MNLIKNILFIFMIIIIHIKSIYIYIFKIRKALGNYNLPRKTKFNKFINIENYNKCKESFSKL